MQKVRDFFLNARGERVGGFFRDTAYIPGTSFFLVYFYIFVFYIFICTSKYIYSLFLSILPVFLKCIFMVSL